MVCHFKIQSRLKNGRLGDTTTEATLRSNLVAILAGRSVCRIMCDNAHNNCKAAVMSRVKNAFDAIQANPAIRNW
jgi:hypothetical protein